MNVLGRDQFQSLLLGSTQWIDVRAPIEVAEGAIPGAVNLPLLTDEERRLVGIRYKEGGQLEAIQLGHQLVHGEVREQRTLAWLDAVKSSANPVIYCFRGGLRSQTVQAWLKEHGVDVPIVHGGYKALRNFLREATAKQSRDLDFLVIAGPTGSAKTKYLRSQIDADGPRSYLDLEALAEHRGSAFGGTEIPQPSQTNFENRVALELLRLGRPNKPVLIENESRMIGRVAVPLELFEKMRASPRLHLQVPLEERVENIFNDYILGSPLGTRADVSHFDSLEKSLRSISKKLGGVRTQEILNDMARCRDEFLSTKDLAGNRVWIRKILLWYYDQLYSSPAKKTEKV